MFIYFTFRRWRESTACNTNTVAACSHQQQAAILTLVAAVFKLGAIIVLICNDNGDLADPDERFVGLIRGRDRQREFPLTLSVKADCRGDVTCRGHVTMTMVMHVKKQWNCRVTQSCHWLPVSGSMSKPDEMPSLCMMPYLTCPFTPMSASWAWTRRTCVPGGWFSWTTAFWL